MKKKLIQKYKNTYDVTGLEVSIESIVKNIADVSLKAQSSIVSQAYEKLIKETDLKQTSQLEKNYSKLKLKLPSVTWAGTFAPVREAENLKNHSQLIVLDIDAKENLVLNDSEVFASIRNQFCEDPYTFICFTSPSGAGIKLVYRINGTSEQHKFFFSEIEEYILDSYQLKIDPSGKDLNRLCFLVHDPKIYVNYKSLSFDLHRMNIPEKEEKDLLRLLPKEKIELQDLQTCADIFKFSENKESYTPGTRNRFLWLFANNCNRKGINQGECLDYCFAVMSDREKSEIRLSVNNAYTKNAAEFGIYRSSQALRDDKGIVTTKRRENSFVEAENFIASKYQLRFNEVSNRIEQRKKDDDFWRDMNENNIYRDLMHNHYSFSINKLTALLRSDFVQNYNPFQQYFEELKPFDALQEPDHIKNLCSYIQTSDRERFDKHFKKHLIRTLVCAIDNKYYNKQAFVLVHDKQNSGKSTFCRWLCPPLLEKYFGENINLTNKDGEIALSEKFIINMDELAALSKYEINQLKSVFSRDKISLRRPFDRSTTDSPRRCSFFGSTNRIEFLADETGSVRWLCFEIENINWDYKKDIDINRVWAQVFYLYKQGFKYDLNQSEIVENELANEKFSVGSPEEDLLRKMYLPGTSSNNDAFLTTTEICQNMKESCNGTIQISPVTLGRMMTKNHFMKVSKYNAYGNNSKGYYIKYLRSV